MIVKTRYSLRCVLVFACILFFVPQGFGANRERLILVPATSTPTVIDIHSIRPANGIFLNPNGTYFDYCSVSGCLEGPHLLAGAVFDVTTHAGAEAQESAVAINMTSNKGKAEAWQPHKLYAEGDRVKADGNIYRATRRGQSASRGKGPTGTGPVIADGSLSWAFVAGEINDGKEGLSIALDMQPGSGSSWTMDSAIDIKAGIGAVAAFGYEQDTAYHDRLDRGLDQPLLVGFFQFGSAMAAPGTAAHYIGMGGKVASYAWHYGTLVNGDNVVKDATWADATSSRHVFYALGPPHVHEDAFRDDTNSPRSMDIHGHHQVGIDLSSGAYGTAIALPQNNFIGLKGSGANLLGYNAVDAALTYGVTNSGTAYNFASWDNGDFTVARHLWSRGRAPKLSSCGGSPRLKEGASDLHGTIVEGVGARGCKLTFDAAYNGQPDCIIQAWDGRAFPVQDFASTSTTLDYSHALGNHAKFTYQCMGR